MDISDTLGLTFIQKGKAVSIYNKQIDIVERDVNGILFLDSSYLFGRQNDTGVLFKVDSLNLIIKADFLDIIKINNGFRIYHKKRDDELSTQDLISHYSLSGNHLIGPAYLMNEFDDGRFIFRQLGKSFIGLEDGTKLSEEYDYIDPSVRKGYRMVMTASNYSYINDSTYEKLPFEAPIVFQKRGPKEDDGGGFFRSIVMFFNVITLPFSPIVMPELWKYALDADGYNPNELIMIEPYGAYFSEGYFPVCIDKFNNGDSLKVLKEGEQIHFNYVNEEGQLLSKKRYLKCLPFSHGKAWVKTEKGFILINKQEKRLKKGYQYDDMFFYDGYYITVNKYTGYAVEFFFWGFGEKKYTEYGLISPEHEVLYDCEYSLEQVKSMVDAYNKQK